MTAPVGGEPLDLEKIGRELRTLHATQGYVGGFGVDAERLLTLAREMRRALEGLGTRDVNMGDDWCCCGSSGVFDGSEDSGHDDYCRRARAALALATDGEGR
jgi:hypothetical protein